MRHLEVNVVLKPDVQCAYNVTLWRIRLNVFCNGDAKCVLCVLC
jgi:hypothetical protein